MKIYLEPKPLRRGSSIIHFISSEKRNGERSYWLGIYHDQVLKQKVPYLGEGREYNQCCRVRITQEAYKALRDQALMWQEKVRKAK